MDDHLCRIADRHATGRLLAFGGAYERDHTAGGWTDVVAAMVENTSD